MKLQDKKIRGVARLLRLTKNEDELVGLLYDLFTEAEISKAYERIKIFSCLNGGMSQRETRQRSRAAIATVNHGAKFFKNSALMIADILKAAQGMNWWNHLFWRT